MLKCGGAGRLPSGRGGAEFLSEATAPNGPQNAAVLREPGSAVDPPEAGGDASVMPPADRRSATGACVCRLPRRSRCTAPAQRAAAPDAPQYAAPADVLDRGVERVHVTPPSPPP